MPRVNRPLPKQKRNSHPNPPPRRSQRKSRNKLLGYKGEAIAGAYLEGQGYQILQRNYTVRWGELDIIARIIDPSTSVDTIVFVEVKTRVSTNKGTPAEAISQKKKHTLMRCARHVLADPRYSGCACRLDAIAVTMRTDGAVCELKHFQNILA